MSILSRWDSVVDSVVSMSISELGSAFGQVSGLLFRLENFPSRV